jgi:outer membrane protein OmpA-like peptidoglycan-associated protein
MRTGRAGESVTGGTTACPMVAACLAASLVFLSFVATARAQDPSLNTGEVPIGTFKLGAPHDGFSVVEPPAGLPERKRDSGEDGSGSWFFQNWQSTSSRDATAERLYAGAMSALQDGRRDEAQRLLEQLIADAPDSPRAALARQQLGKIYRSVDTNFDMGSTTRTSDQATRGAGLTSSSELPVRPSTAPAPSRMALHQARVSPGLDGQFLAEAGDRVFFAAGSTDLGARARGVIQSQARFLKRYPELFVAIEGFADDGAIPGEETQRLSDDRAAVVRDRLVAEGVNEQRILAYGRAQEDRVSDCPQPECMAQNRRAVTIVLSRKLDPGPSPRRAQNGGDTPNVSPTQ